MNIKFNIIYTPGNAKYLRLFVLSLLKWSDCNFRIVINGCGDKEKKLLEQFCEKYSRLEYFVLPYDEMLLHGDALAYLQKKEESDYFCFMDSDIFVTGNFMNEFSPYLNQYSGIFSGSAIWLSEQDQILEKSNMRMGGRFHWTNDNFCLGSSFFAIYNNKILTQLLKDTGVTFDKYSSWQKLPPKFKQDIVELDLKKNAYDTGKIINLLLQSHGNKILYINSKTLCHLGGLSSLKIGPLSKVPPKGIKRFRKNISRFTSVRNWRNKDRMREKEYQSNVKYNRFDTAEYFSNILRSLFENQPITATLNISDQTEAKKIQFARHHIEALYDEFKNELIQ